MKKAHVIIGSSNSWWSSKKCSLWIAWNVNAWKSLAHCDPFYGKYVICLKSNVYILMSRYLRTTWNILQAYRQSKDHS